MTADPAAIATLGSDRLRPTRRRGYSTAWWGMATVIMTEGTIFLALLASYFFLRASASEWPLDGIELPKLGLSVPFSLVLWASSGPIFVAESAIRRGNVRRLRAGLFITFVMGAAFVGYSAFDFQELRFGWRDNAYGSIYYTIVGLHLAHVVVGLLMNLVVQAKAWLGKLDRGRHVSVEVYSLYWHFVDVVWVFVFPSLFLSPHLQ